MWKILTLWRKTYTPWGMRFTVPWFALMLCVIVVGGFIIVERIYGPF